MIFIYKDSSPEPRTNFNKTWLKASSEKGNSILVKQRITLLFKMPLLCKTFFFIWLKVIIEKIFLIKIVLKDSCIWRMLSSINCINGSNCIERKSQPLLSFRMFWIYCYFTVYGVPAFVPCYGYGIYSFDCCASG